MIRFNGLGIEMTALYFSGKEKGKEGGKMTLCMQKKQQQILLADFSFC